MEEFLLIVAIASFAISVSIFILSIFKHGYKGLMQTKSSKFSIIFFMYILHGLYSYFHFFSIFIKLTYKEAMFFAY